MRTSTSTGLALVSALLLGSSGCILVATTTDTCSDGLRNSGESDVDCGGLCGSCAEGRKCLDSSDCASSMCSAGRCSTTRFTGGSVPSVNTTTYQITPNVGTVVQPGTQAGFGITANVGGSYRLVWTGDATTSGLYREFWGSVWTAGTFSNIVRSCNDSSCPLESNDYVSASQTVSGGHRIDFDAFTTTGLDGFDFVGTDPVYFDLFIDGERYPDLVFFPSTNGPAVAGTMPFGLTTQ